MTRAQHPLGEHLTTCSGPDNCAEYAAVLAMTPMEHARYVNDSTARFAQKRTATLRTAVLQIPLTDDKATLTRLIEARLRRESPGFMRVVDVDIEARTGTYEEREDDTTVTHPFTFELDGDVVVLKTASTTDADTPPNPYTLAIAQRRAAEATPESRFSEQYKTERLREFNIEYATPDPWAAHIAKMEESR